MTKVAGAAGCANHSMVWLRRAQGHKHSKCEQPDWAGCESCGKRELWRCGTSNLGKCRPCGETYRRRVGRVALSGQRLEGNQTHLLTVTAPGDKEHIDKRTGQRCPCTGPEGTNLAEWNAGLGERWNRFHQDLERHFGQDVQYFAAKEVQARGALHLHVPFRLRVGTRWKLEEIRALAIKHGFGHEIDLRTDIDERGMWYVAKYVSKAAGLRSVVPWRKVKGQELVERLDVDPETGEILGQDVDVVEVVSTKASYQTWSKSRRWGLTMKAVKAAQAQWVHRGGDAGAPAPEAPLDHSGFRYTDSSNPGRDEGFPAAV